jgi:hypothetical protein
VDQHEMTESVSTSIEDTTSPPARRPRKAPAWAIAGILLLFGAGYAWSTFNSRSGPQVTWMNNFDAALARAGAEKKRIFLMLSEPGDQAVAAMDRNLFPLRQPRETLAQMVCCRLEIQPRDPICARYDCSVLPHCFVLDPLGRVLESRLTGQVDELAFFTYVKPR